MVGDKTRLHCGHIDVLNYACGNLDKIVNLMTMTLTLD